MSKMGGNLTSDTDPNSVTVLRKGVVSHKTLKTAADLNAAQRRGVEIETSRKVTAGSNKQHSSDKNAARLDEETEQLHHDRVPLAVGRTIQQGRQTKEWSQKDLATHINEKPQIVAEYESGKAVPNQQVLNKMEKALGIHLRGKDMGKPLPVKVVAAAPAQAKKK